MEDKSSSLIGVNQLVHRDDGSWHMAKLIQKRENPDTHHTEYYVHYDGCKLARACKEDINYYIFVASK